MFELTEAVCLLGDRTRAAEMYRLLLPYGDRHISAMRGTVSWGSGQTVLGRLSGTIGNLDQAAQHFEAALDLEHQWRARAWLVKTQASYAAVLVERDGVGDREAAFEFGREAIVQAEALHIAPAVIPKAVRRLTEVSLQSS
jgi:tetratricopeptide (TPR) repeat protein